MDAIIFILAVAGAILGLVIVVVVIELYVRGKQRRKLGKEKWSVISIRVGRDNETGPLVAEQIFSTIHGITRKLNFWSRLKGNDQYQISFEIAYVERNIRFFVHFPSRLRNLIEGQIYAQYPNIEISEVEDYAAGVFKNEELVKNAISAELRLMDPGIFPIKRYQQFEDKKAKFPLDPLAAITSTMSKFNHPEDQAWIQLIVKPLEDNWRVVFTKCIRILNKGIYLNIEALQKFYANAFCTRSRLVRILFFPLYWLFFLQGLRAGTKGLSFSSASGSGDAVETQIARSHDKETSIVAAMDKVGKLLYESNLRVVYLPKNRGKEEAMVKLREIAGSYKQFNIPHLNGFEITRYETGKGAVESFRARRMVHPYVLNVEELATLFHLPNITVTTPNINWVRSKKLEPPNDLPVADEKEQDVTLIGKTNFRSSALKFGIKTADRRRHIYIIGKTGMGKSTLLENMIFSDIQAGKGVAVVDPHGDLADAVLNYIPSNRTNDVVIFDPADREFPVAFNMLENIDPSFNSIICSGLIGIFKKIYAESWGPRLEHILRNTILALLEYPNTTMLGILRMLQDRDFRMRVIRKVNDPIVKSFWLNEFEKMEPKNRIEAISPILNKVGQFLSYPIVRNILGQPKSAIDFRFAMDHKKIVVVNLSKGKIGEDISSLLGSMIITKFQLDAMSRAGIPEKDRVDFYLYVDEFQNFATDSFATILSEARKYKLNLTMANQYIAQMPEEVRDAVFGNVGTIISFQVGFDDADYLSSQYGEEALPNDLVALSKYTSYTRLLIDGMPSKTFSMATLPAPLLEIDPGRKEKIIRLARERYATPKDVVEDKIRRWSEGGLKDEE